MLLEQLAKRRLEEDQEKQTDDQGRKDDRYVEDRIDDRLAGKFPACKEVPRWNRHPERKQRSDGAGHETEDRGIADRARGQRLNHVPRAGEGRTRHQQRDDQQHVDPRQTGDRHGEDSIVSRALHGVIVSTCTG